MDINIDKNIDTFKAYAEARMAEEKGDVSPMLLKKRHTMRVLANARNIIEAERPPLPLARATLLAALYHDVARFEQYLRYKSFRDAQTCNHGLLGIKIIKKEQMLAGENKNVAGLAMAAIGLHNRFALPAALAPSLLFAANVVRDADKLDILRVMDEHLGGPGPHNPAVVLSLPDDPLLHSEKALSAALSGHVASYSDLKSVNDFRLLLGTWFYEMHFETSRKRFREDGHALKLVSHISQNPVYARACAGILRDLAPNS